MLQRHMLPNKLATHATTHAASCRQKRELDQLVEYEVRRSQIQAKAEAKLAKQEERAEVRSSSGISLFCPSCSFC